LNAELETQDFIFNKLFRWTTKSILVGLRSGWFAWNAN
jgi:endo-1,4-beta-D-glucanase Y